MNIAAANDGAQAYEPDSVQTLSDTMKRVSKAKIHPLDKVMLAVIAHNLQDALKKLDERRLIQAVKSYRTAMEVRDRLFSQQNMKSTPNRQKSVTLFSAVIDSLIHDTSQDKNRAEDLQEIGALHREFQDFEQRLHQADTGDTPHVTNNYPVSDNMITIQSAVECAAPGQCHHWQVPSLQKVYEKIITHKNYGGNAADLLHYLRHADLQLRLTPEQPDAEQTADLHHSIYNLSQSFAGKINTAHNPFEKNYWKKLHREVNLGLQAQLSRAHPGELKHLKQELAANQNSPQSFSYSPAPSPLHRAWTAIKKVFGRLNLVETWEKANHQPTLQEIIAKEQSQQNQPTMAL
ncbi:MAG: hypothetical protein H6867_02400 [Rhodospirillales bacterium]|nr:hypothetical protein [Rhodospirillales bacterium]MCB9997040.1 hypothetical protein [Rhodospirillales bacterium]